MRFSIITLFPGMFESFLRASLVGKACEAGTLRVDFVDPRDFACDRHRTVDDAPFGGGDGMVLKPEPMVAAIESVVGSEGVVPHRMLLTPDGVPLSQAHLRQLAQRQHLVLICGRYEGYDERIRGFADAEVSLGDFVLSGGEVAAMALIEGTSRLVPGVIGNEASLQQESHEGGLLEYPQYTRPREFRGMEVPEVLLSGHHEAIGRWRDMQRIARTKQRRPDLWARFSGQDGGEVSGQDGGEVSGQDGGKVSGQDGGEARLTSRGSPADSGRVYAALLHYPVLNREGAVVTTSITNLDLHDIARCARTYGLAKYFVVTPLACQQALAHRILSHWRDGHGARVQTRRSEALALVETVADVEAAMGQIERAEGCRPLTVATSARSGASQVPITRVREEVSKRDRPVLLLFGTGWGLDDAVLAGADLQLAPVHGPTDYNHLSVRAAAAIILDRLLGLRDEP